MRSLLLVLATASAAWQAAPTSRRFAAKGATSASAIAMTFSEDVVPADGRTRRAVLQQVTGAATAGALSASLPSYPAAAEVPTWEVVSLPIVSETPPILFDIEFDTKNPKLGWIVGNGGSSWERVPLSPKLPGDPYGIVALGPGKAEMSTSAGAIYVTDNAGRNWKAQVRETIDATLNRVSSSGVQGASYFSGSINSIQRDADGSYLAVSSRGNFYLTYKPGEEFWIPHNRETSRRITSMGFIKDRMTDGLWMTTAGGEISKTPAGAVDTQLINIPFEKLQIRSGGYGLLDVAFLPDGKTAWAVGGGGTIFGSKNGGESWEKDKAADDLPSNLYKVKFFPDGTGYVLGSSGVLLRNKAA